MELLTKEISEKLQEQFPMGSDFEQMVIAKLFDPCGSWTWYLMNQDPEDPDYLWGIVDGFEVEMGSISLSELESFKGKFGLGIERDLYFNPIPAREIWEKLNKGQHV
jgi:hypothetical protein